MVKGYKVFNEDWTCRKFQYEVGKTYEMNDTPRCCENGFHFCEKAIDCFNYYSFDPNNKVAEVIALGEIDTEENKFCTNKIQIIREIPWSEVLELVNSGSRNSGSRNSGSRNSGSRNSGSRNSGSGNSGSGNSGSGNSGDWNSGDWNSGDWNSGDWNSGDWNKSSHNTGCFNTKKSHITFFNKPANITIKEWYNSEARCILNKMPQKNLKWVKSEFMSDEEKEAYPEHKTTGGYLKEIDGTRERQEWWNDLSESKKEIIKAIPNLDAAIFYEITGINVE